MLIRCSKNWSLIFAKRHRNTHVLSAQVEIVTGGNWNMHRHALTATKSRYKIIPRTLQSHRVHSSPFALSLRPSRDEGIY